MGNKLEADKDGYLHVGRLVIKADHLIGVKKDEFVKAHSKTLRHEVYNAWDAIKSFTKAKPESRKKPIEDVGE